MWLFIIIISIHISLETTLILGHVYKCYMKLGVCFRTFKARLYTVWPNGEIQETVEDGVVQSSLICLLLILYLLIDLIWCLGYVCLSLLFLWLLLILALSQVYISTLQVQYNSTQTMQIPLYHWTIIKTLVHVSVKFATGINLTSIVATPAAKT